MASSEATKFFQQNLQLVCLGCIIIPQRKMSPLLYSNR